MATTVFVQVAKMGSTTYYIGKMKATDLTTKVNLASRLPNWGDMSVDERIQREIADDRVKKELVPYLQRDADRFFGALIVDIYRGWDDVQFEPLSQLCKNLPSAYRVHAMDAGFLTFLGDEYLVALDGQHRLQAFKYAMAGDDGSIDPMPELSSDEVTVIFVRHESDVKIRNIFNKVNRYAKGTSRGDNIITAEDDVMAIVARRLIREGEGVLSPKLVNWKSNTLSQRSVQLTTISTVYETVQVILEDKPELKSKVRIRPSDDVIDEYFHEAYEVWDAVLGGLGDYRGLATDEIVEKRKSNLLFRPIGQVAVFKGLQIARTHGELSLDEAVERLNSRVEWDKDAELWQHILVKPDGGMIARQENKDLAGELIAYLIAKDELSRGFVEQLARRYAEKRGENWVGKEPKEILPEPKAE